MSDYAKILSLSYNSAAAVKEDVAKTSYYSVRLIKDTNNLGQSVSSNETNILLNGKCIDPKNRRLYLFYIDGYYGSAWIIEINIDNRTQTVVYFDRYNAIGFSAQHKIYNARVVNGKIIWTDNHNPIYQIDIERAKKSFYYGIGYNQNTTISEWNEDDYYYVDQIVSGGNYFYKCLIVNQGLNPTAWTTYWEKLCLIEDAYYSMNVENFYFAPMPPTDAPGVIYQTDSARKINNLRQTLFQFAYNYVYMDYRESTYSPASIVMMPDGEEEIATGLASENISLNNVFKITVNSGGEEVRKIRIIGRSSRDPSTWFLVEEIEKFSFEEREYENSSLFTVDNATIVISVPVPVVMTTGLSIQNECSFSALVPLPVAEMYFVASTEMSMAWSASEFGAASEIIASITVPAGMATIIAIPAWITGTNFSLHPLIVGTTIPDGTDINVYPASSNGGAERTGNIILQDSYGDTCVIAVTQYAAPVLPTVMLQVIESDSWTITESTSVNTYVNIGSTSLHIGFKAHDLSSPGGVTLAVQVIKNGSHLMWDTTIGRNEFYLSDTITLPVAATYGDEYVVILDEP